MGNLVAIPVEGHPPALKNGRSSMRFFYNEVSNSVGKAWPFRNSGE